MFSAPLSEVSNYSLIGTFFPEAIETNFQYLWGIDFRPEDGVFRQPAILSIIHHGCRIGT